MEDFVFHNRKTYPYIPRNEVNSEFNRKISAYNIFTNDSIKDKTSCLIKIRSFSPIKKLANTMASFTFYLPIRKHFHCHYGMYFGNCTSNRTVYLQLQSLFFPYILIGKKWYTKDRVHVQIGTRNLSFVYHIILHHIFFFVVGILVMPVGILLHRNLATAHR